MSILAAPPFGSALNAHTRVLVAEPDRVLANLVCGVLRRHGAKVVEIVDTAALDEEIQALGADLLVANVGLALGEKGDLLDRAHQLDPDVPVMVLVPGRKEGLVAAISALRNGAFDFLEVPIRNPDELVARAERAIEGRRLRLEVRRAEAELRIANQELRRVSQTDELTGLLSRRHFLERLVEEIERAHRYGRAIGLLLIDVDRLRSINEQFGHLMGDRVIATVGTHLRSELRQSDLCGRYGGEEFIVMLAETNGEGALLVAEKIRERLSSYAIPTGDGQGQGREVRFTLSIGVTEEAAGGSATIETLLARLDAALVRAKSQGGDRATSG